MAVRILLGKIGKEWARTLLDLARMDRDLEIVGVLESPLELLLRANELRADVVVISQLQDGGEPGICSHLLLEHPNLAVVLLPSPSGPNLLWRMVLRKESWDGASRDALHAALKSADPA